MNRIATMLICSFCIVAKITGVFPRQTTFFTPVLITAWTILLIGGETFSRRSG